MKYTHSALGELFIHRTVTAAVAVTLLASIASPLFTEAQTLEGQLTCLAVGADDQLLLAPRSTGVLNAKPGEVFTVPLIVLNGHDRPLTNLTITAAVYEEGSVAPFDWFVVDEGVTLATKSEARVDLEWSVPPNAPEGSYSVSVFATPGVIDTVAAHTLSRDAAETKIDVEMGAGAAPAAHFDLSSLSLNGESVSAGSVASFAADETELTVAIDIVNRLSSTPLRGVLEMQVYEGLVPNQDAVIDEESTEARLVSNSSVSKGFTFTANFDYYLVTGQMQLEDGSRSSFSLPLVRTGATVPLAPTAPLTSLTARNTDGTNLEVVGCIVHRDSALMSDGEVSAGYDAKYIITLHPASEAGAAIEEVTLGRAEGVGELGGGIGDLGFKATIAAPTEPFVLRTVVERNGVVQESRDVFYTCGEGSPCAVVVPPAPEYVPTNFIETAQALLKSLISATWFILVLLSLLFLLATYPIIKRMRARKRAKEVAETKSSDTSFL